MALGCRRCDDNDRDDDDDNNDDGHDDDNNDDDEYEIMLVFRFHGRRERWRFQFQCIGPRKRTLLSASGVGMKSHGRGPYQSNQAALRLGSSLLVSPR